MKNKRKQLVTLFVGILLLIALISLLIYREFAPEDQEAQVVGSIAGLGLLGASETDEYRGPSENRGGNFADVTFNWMELLANTSSVSPNYYSQRKISPNINVGPWGDYGGLRRVGFAYNWARSGQQTRHLEAQTAGLVPYVAQGQVSHVVIIIGANDFSTINGTYGAIYNKPSPTNPDALSDEQISAKVQEIVADFNESVDALKAAKSNVKITVATIGDAGLAITNLGNFPNPPMATQMNCLLNNIPAGTPPCMPEGRLRVSYAIKAVNQGLMDTLTPKGVKVIDFHGFTLGLISKVDTNGNIIVDGVAIDATKKCNDPKCLQLSDQIGHGGTVINGLIANLVVENINSAYNTNISLFSECQILANAGIKPLSECGSVPLSPTPDAEATITPSVTPTNRVQLTGTTTPINTPTGTTVPGGTNTPIPSQTPVAPTNTTVPTTPGATSLPQPTPTIQPTNLPQPTPGVGIACGKADVNNDGKFTLVDFRDFAKIYQRECNDGHLDYGECGHKDSDRNGKIEIRDFMSFAGRYYPRESCSL